MDTGLLSAAVPVSSVAERRVGYRYYTEWLAALPYFVGGHWFQPADPRFRPGVNPRRQGPL